MTAKKFYFYSFLQWVIFTALKLWFFKYEIFSNPGVQQTVFWIITGVIAVAIIRRVGILNYMEVLFAMVFWTAGDAFLDLLITSSFTGSEIFSRVDYWAGFLVMDVAIFIFHKKRHVHVRHELRAKAHAQHQALLDKDRKQ